MPCYFGQAMKQKINWAVAARKKYPNICILATKLDIKAAFRRCHLNASTAIQTCTQLPELCLALMMLRLTFGGAPCPSEFGAISETICNLINAILQHDDWDPLTLFAETAQANVPPKETFKDDAPFGIGRDLIVDIPVDARGIVDLYIDNFIGLTVDLDKVETHTHTPTTQPDLNVLLYLASQRYLERFHLSNPYLVTTWMHETNSLPKRVFRRPKLSSAGC
jgi:hypothetical protein